MDNHISAKATAGLFAAFVLATGISSATTTERPAATDCSNPAIPREIIDGGASKPGSHPMHVARATAPGGTLTLAVAGTDADQDAGLACVPSLKPGSGMVYVFTDTKKWEFWEHDSRIPLDYVWLDENGKVTQVFRNLSADGNGKPGSGYAHRSGIGRYVILLNAGETRTDKIQEGSTIAIPDLYRAPRPATPTPSPTPSAAATPQPTMAPTIEPTPAPTMKPAPAETPKPTPVPTAVPTARPTTIPTMTPTATPQPPSKASQTPASTTTTTPMMAPVTPKMVVTPSPSTAIKQPSRAVPVMAPTLSPTTKTPQTILHSVPVKNLHHVTATPVPIRPATHKHDLHPTHALHKTAMPSDPGRELFPVQDHFEVKVDH